ncbi:MFS transporter [Baaleninema simplex]|uniref:MFS transporter n=1 Tax=Baaleninema simplex TaxID=2862350 RepID=UPI0003488BC8|nr:MFS transporter [Baaleninema simplex]
MKQLSEPDLTPEETIPKNSSPPPPKEETGFGPVFKNKNFLTLWSGQVFSQIADKVYLVMAISIVASRFQAANQSISGWVSAITIAFTIPAVLFGFLAGVLVDRWHKKEVLVVTNLLRGVFVLVLPVLFWLTREQSFAGLSWGFGVLLGITFLVSTLTQFFAPAEQAAIPLIVKRKHLLSANSLYTTTMMASAIVGFAVGEPMLAIADRALQNIGFSQELVVGGSYVLAGMVLLLLRTRENLTNLQAASAKRHVWEDFKDGLRVLKRQPRVRSALVQLIVLFCIFAALAVLAVRLAEIMPALKSSQFGFLLASSAAGMAVGAALVGQIGSQFAPRRLSLYGSMGMAASLVALSLLTQQLVPSLVAIAALGFSAAWVGIPMQTIIQAETPEEQRGKVFGLQNNAVNIALSLPLALASVAESFFGLSAVLASLAAIVVAAGLITWYIADKSSRSAAKAKTAR